MNSIVAFNVSSMFRNRISFDTDHSVTLKATITSFVWTNPHPQIYFDVKKGEAAKDSKGVGIVADTSFEEAL